MKSIAILLSLIFFCVNTSVGQQHVSNEIKNELNKILSALNESTDIVKTESEQKKICQAFADFAKQVMTERQNGKQISSFIEIVKNEKYPKIMQTIVESAYETNLQFTQSLKSSTISEFKNKYLLPI